MNFNLNSGYGQLLAMQIASAVGPTFGQVLVVLEDSDNADLQSMLGEIFVPDTNGRVRFFRTLEAAYTAAVSNNNDVILLSAHTTHAISTGIAWSKNRINVIGMDGGGRTVQQGAKIELSGAVDSAYVLKVTGVRNSFRNIKFIQSSTHANALNVVQFAGEGNLYEDCSFVFGVADNLDLTTSAEALMGEDSGTFRRCSFGTDVLLTSGARNVMAFDAITGASSADGAKSNRFIECEWLVMSSEANAQLLKVVDTAGAKFLNEFIDCRYMAVLSSGGGGIAITNAVQSVASFVDGSFHFIRPSTNGCTNFCATLNANFTISGAPVFSSNAHEGGTPA
jgi:hypothetical protein